MQEMVQRYWTQQPSESHKVPNMGITRILPDKNDTPRKEKDFKRGSKSIHLLRWARSLVWTGKSNAFGVCLC